MATQRELGELRTALEAQQRALATLTAQVQQLQASALSAATPAPVVPAALLPVADDLDGLTPELRLAIRDFAGSEPAVARHLANEARRRLLGIRRLPERDQQAAITDLAEQLREGETYTGRIPL